MFSCHQFNLIISIFDLAPTGNMSQGRIPSNMHQRLVQWNLLIHLLTWKIVLEQQNTMEGIPAPRIGCPPKESNNHSEF